jgi:hypothetical protein
MSSVATLSPSRAPVNFFVTRVRSQRTAAVETGLSTRQSTIS